MLEDYIITNDELATRFGLDLTHYALDTTYVPMILNIAFGKAITRVLHLNDNFKYEEDIENALEKEPRLLRPFKKLQFQVVYNLVFLGDNDPMTTEVDNIICGDLRWGKINGFQKNIFYK